MFALFLMFFIAPQSMSQLPSKVKIDDELQRERMIQISRQLGVTCVACHNTSNFAADDKINFKIAKEHIRITQALIDSGMDGKNNRPLADCYMCHRGKLMPDYREPFDPMTMEKIKKDTKKNSKAPIAPAKDEADE